MNNEEFRRSCDRALVFVQRVMDAENIGLRVSTLSEDEFAEIVRDQRPELNWIKYFPHFCTDNCF